ncbi:MAG: hypothetical protein AAB869_02325 [Patescibacteria group bacterium]
METKSLDSSKSRKFEPRGIIAVVLNDEGPQVNPEVLRTVLLGIEREHSWVEKTAPCLEKPSRLCILKVSKAIVGVNGYLFEFLLRSDLHHGQIVAFCNYIDKIATVLAGLKIEGVKSVSREMTFEIYFGDCETTEGGRSEMPLLA